LVWFGYAAASIVAVILFGGMNWVDIYFIIIFFSFFIAFPFVSYFFFIIFLLFVEYVCYTVIELNIMKKKKNNTEEKKQPSTSMGIE